MAESLISLSNTRLTKGESNYKTLRSVWLNIAQLTNHATFTGLEPIQSNLS